ncbi:MAG: TIGR04211 family SH3 domain-containing protein [Acidobacteriota bacterium]
MKKGILFLSVVAATLCFYHSAWAVKAYIIDPKEASMRSGPGTQNRVILSIPSGTAVEVLKGNDYTHIRYTLPDGQTKEGWVNSRSLGPRPPEEALTKELESENGALREKLAMTEKEKSDLTQKEKEITDKLAKLENAHEALKNGSANYIKLKDEYDAVKLSLAQSQENIQTLIQENQNLRAFQNLKWFAIGSIVLFLGWFIGWITGKRQKKRRSTYFF